MATIDEQRIQGWAVRNFGCDIEEFERRFVLEFADRF